MKNTTRIGIVLCISVAFFLAEIIGAFCPIALLVSDYLRCIINVVGFRTKSLALIADAVRTPFLFCSGEFNLNLLILVPLP